MITGLLPEDPKPTPNRLNPKQMADWNSFVDFLDKKGLKGHESLNKKSKNLGAALFDEFKKSNPNASIDYSVIPSVQYEMQLLQKGVRDFDARHGNPNSKLMEGISPVDGWLGSKTSSFKFFPQVVTAVNNPNVIEKNEGLLNGSMQPTGMQTALNPRKGVILPKGVKPFKVSDGSGNSYYVYENSDGDLVPLK